MSIRYLGLKVVSVKMENFSNQLRVRAEATGLGSIATQMDNLYESTYFDEYLPFSYRKVIKQKEYSENRITIYSRDTNKGIRESYVDKSRSRRYDIHPETRDFFSALYYIRFHLKKSTILYLDANGLIWKAKCQLLKQEKVKAPWGKDTAQKVKITFSRYSSGERERSDMLTNNLVNDSNVLYLWISTDEKRLPIKAEYKMKPFSVYWKLESYE